MVWAQTANPSRIGTENPKTATAVGNETAPDPSYLKLREIEERVSRLKEKVFQAKARLVQLQEVVLHGNVAGAKLVLTHRNDMGGSFKLSRLQYFLDGAVIFNRNSADVPDLGKPEEQEVFTGPLEAGSHQLSVFIEYGGNGYGLFDYLEGYTFRVKAGQTFMAEEGHVIRMKVVGFEQGSFITEMKDRPAVRFEVDGSKDLRTEGAANGATPGDSASSSPGSPPPAGNNPASNSPQNAAPAADRPASGAGSASAPPPG